MTYATCWIIRFRGTLTQGPNAGREYDWRGSWGGVMFDSEAAARGALAEDRAREPGLSYRLLARQWQGGRKGRFVETEITI